MGMNSGYVGVDRRAARAGVFGLDKLYLECLNGTWSAFSVLDLPNVMQWFDASTISGLSNNDTVLTLNDHSLSHNTASGSGSGGPKIYRTNRANGRPGVLFQDNPNKGFMQFTEMANVRMAYVVMQFHNVPADYTPIWGRTNVESQFMYNGRFNTTSYTQAGWNGGSWYLNGTLFDPTTTTIPMETPFVLSVATSENVIVDRITGDRSYSDRCFNADVFEWILGSAVHSNTNRQMCEAYLNAKWGIS